MNIRQIFIGFLLFYIILLIIAFIIMVLSYSKKEWRLPPLTCPDFWIKKTDGICYNTHKIKYNGNPLISSSTFDTSNCDGINSIRSKGITWDGVTYGYGSNNPC